MPRELTPEEADKLLASPKWEGITRMMHYTAAGEPDLVARYVRNFAAEANVDEVITVHPSPTIEERLRSVDLLADAFDPVTV